MHGDAWSHLVYTSNTTGAVWRPFKRSLEMHGASWSHCVNFKSVFLKPWVAKAMRVDRESL